MPPEPGDRRERREVRSDDPSLSPETNARLTEELRDVIGSDEVEVAPGTEDVAHERHGGRDQLLDVLVENRIIVVSGVALVLVVGLVIAALTGHWWIVAVAVAVDIVGTLALGATIFQLADDTEHPSPTLAAEMEDEGDPDPDRTFTELVDEFRDARPGPRGSRGEPPAGQG